MDSIFKDINKNRLFTYKVQHDGGSAPNPYKGACTLAICKPVIRRTANPGDVIVGFACKSNGDNERRIVYCMVVDEVIKWSDYADGCKAGRYPNKIPMNENDPGDCIWGVDGNSVNGWVGSWSGHGPDDYERDVLSGLNVLLGRQFWYFGRGDKHSLLLDEDINIVPYGQGHRSNLNHAYREQFDKFMCTELDRIGPSGIYGTPAIPHTTKEHKKCSSCRTAERLSDQIGEEAG